MEEMSHSSETNGPPEGEGLQLTKWSSVDSSIRKENNESGKKIEHQKMSCIASFLEFQFRHDTNALNSLTDLLFDSPIKLIKF